MMLPKKRTRAPMGLKQAAVIKCPSHLRWVRGHECCIAGKTSRAGDHLCEGKIEAHHVTTRGAGGGDEQVVSLCSKAHAMVHQMGRASFGSAYLVDLDRLAAEFWKRSPHGQKYRIENDRR